MNKVLSYGLIIAALIAVMIYAIFYLLRSPSPAEVASQVIDSYDHQDAQKLYSLAPPVERRLYNLSVSKLRDLMTISHFGATVKPDGKLMEQNDPSSGRSEISRWYKINGASKALFAVSASRREHNLAVADRPVTDLIYDCLYAYGAGPEAPEKPLIFIHGIDSLANKLENFGFPGVMDPTESRIIPWSELKAQFLVRYQKYLDIRKGDHTPQLR